MALEHLAHIASLSLYHCVQCLISTSNLVRESAGIISLLKWSGASLLAAFSPLSIERVCIACNTACYQANGQRFLRYASI